MGQAGDASGRPDGNDGAAVVDFEIGEVGLRLHVSRSIREVDAPCGFVLVGLVLRAVAAFAGGDPKRLRWRAKRDDAPGDLVASGLVQYQPDLADTLYGANPMPL